jgi:hypothetical protein
VGGPPPARPRLSEEGRELLAREGLPVPRTWSDVTPSWMTGALSHRLPAVGVSGVEVVGAEEGTNARARVVLSYARGTGPASVFVKRQGRPVNRLALLALRALATEARLALSGAPLAIDRPLPYGGGVDWPRLGAVVVMDDVEAAGAVPNDPRRAIGVADVRAGLEGLARLHAAFWTRNLPPELGFLRPWRLGAAWSAVSVVSLARGLRRLRGLERAFEMPPGVDARRLAREFSESAAAARRGEQTLLHGDAHLGNTYAIPGGRTGFLDWQLARTGNWSHDVGYFIVSSLGVEDRRTHDEELLAGYLDALGEAGAAPPVWPRARERYRATPAFGLATWLHTLSFGTFQPPEVCAAMIARFATARRDLGPSGSSRGA